MKKATYATESILRNPLLLFENILTRKKTSSTNKLLFTVGKYQTVIKVSLPGNESKNITQVNTGTSYSHKMFLALSTINPIQKRYIAACV